MTSWITKTNCPLELLSIWFTGLPSLGWMQEDTLPSIPPTPGAVPRLSPPPQGLLPALILGPGCRPPSTLSPGKLIPHLGNHCHKDLDRLSFVSSPALSNCSFLLTRHWSTPPGCPKAFQTGLVNSALHLPAFFTPPYPVTGSHL